MTAEVAKTHKSLNWKLSFFKTIMESNLPKRQYIASWALGGPPMSSLFIYLEENS